MLRNMKHSEFTAYLERMADGFEDSGKEATAEDYREMVRRLDEMSYGAARVWDYVTGELQEYTV